MAAQPRHSAAPPSKPVERWLIFVFLFAALTHGTWAFVHPDPGAATPQSSVDANDGDDAAAPPAEPRAVRGRSPDEREYVELAISLAEQGELRLPTGDVAKRAPLYPAMLSLIYQTQPRDYWHNAIILLQAFLAWCNTIGIAYIAFKLRNSTAGVLAGIISALYAPFLYLETLYLTETLVISLFISSILIHIFVVLAEGSAMRRTAGMAGVSILVGLMALARADAVLLIIPFALHATFSTSRRHERAARIAAALVPVVLIAGAWCWRNQNEIGRFTLSTTAGLNLHLGNNPDYAKNPGLAHADYAAFDRLRAEGLSEVEADRRLFEMGRRFIFEHTGESAMNGLRKIRVWFTPTIESFGPLLLVIAGGFICISAWRDPRRRGEGPNRNVERWLATAALALAAAAYVVHVATSTRILPFVSPTHVLALGLPSLVLMRSRPPVRGLFIGIFLTQMAVAVTFIPISRLRWTMDALLIIALAVAVSRVCTRLNPGAPGFQSGSPTPPSQGNA